MKDKKIIYYILAIFLLFSIAMSPVIADDFKIENKDIKEKLTKENNLVAVHAATNIANETTENSSSNNNSTNSVTPSADTTSDSDSHSNSTTDTNSTNSSDNTSNSSNTNPNSNSTVSSDNKTNSNTQSTPKVVDTKPKKLTQAQILKASVYINNYVAKYKKLPNMVSIGGYNFSIPEYTYLLSKTIYYKYNKKKTDIVIKYDVKNPTKPTGTKIKGKLTSKQYYTYVKNLLNYIEKNNRIPNYVTTKLGKMQYQTAVYGFNRILYWSYYHNEKLPTSLTLNIAKNHKINKVIPKYTRPQAFTPQINITNNSGSNDFIIVNSKYACGPTEVKYNKECLISTGKCSCGKAGNYYYHTTSFKNYCPYCKVDGSLIYEEGSTCPEGMWVCTKCDADFCLVTGKEHIVNSPKYLTQY